MNLNGTHQSKPDSRPLAAPAELELLGEFHSLAEQIMSAVELSNPTNTVPSRGSHSIENLPQLRRFLETYCAEVLAARDLPAIYEAFSHASRNEIRELIALDSSLGAANDPAPLVSSSQRVGSAQLKKLRPLRDQRIVQRYLQAVERGKASGWHTTVYGLMLSVYSVPLRDGLLHYARQVLRGFIQSAAASRAFPEREGQELHEELCLRLRPAVETLLSRTPRETGRSVST